MEKKYPYFGKSMGIIFQAPSMLWVLLDFSMLWDILMRRLMHFPYGKIRNFFPAKPEDDLDKTKLL